MTDGLGGPEPGASNASWEDPPRAPAPSAAPVLVVDGFEGPLDWLLELARAERIDLRRLSILALVEAFAAALEGALAGSWRADLSRWGEWLGMAAQLTLLRSRLLLPPEAAEARSAQAEAEALRRQLLEAEAMRRAASWLEGRKQLGREVFARGLAADDPLASAARAVDVVQLFRACLAALRVPEHAEAYRPAIPRLWRMQDAVARITRILAERPDRRELRDFLPILEKDGSEHELRCRAALASTLAAALELAREADLRLEQAAQFETISLRPRADAPIVD